TTLFRSLETFLDFGSLFIGVTTWPVGRGRAGGSTGSDRPRKEKVWLKSAGQHFAVHVFGYRHAEQMKKRRSDIDESCICDLRATFKARSTCDQDPIEPVRTTPFGCLRWPMFSNDKCRLTGVFGKARLTRKQAVLAPPIKDKVSALSGKRAMKNFVAAVDPINDWFAGARILELGQFLDDKSNQSVVISGIDDALRLHTFEIDPYTRRRSEHLATVGLGPAPVDAREG